MKDLLSAIHEFRDAFVVAVGDKSPFARIALARLDEAVSRASVEGPLTWQMNCGMCGAVINDPDGKYNGCVYNPLRDIREEEG